jgi:hypothetical protein
LQLTVPVDLLFLLKLTDRSRFFHPSHFDLGSLQRLRVTCAGNLEAFCFISEGGTLCSAKDRTFLSLAANEFVGAPASISLETEYRLHFAQFGDGEGQLFSQILLINQNQGTEALASISLRDDEGEPLDVELNGAVVQGSMDITVPAGGVKRLLTDGEGELTGGSVIINSNQPLGGVVLFGGSAGVAGVGASEVLTAGFLAPIEKSSSAQVNTGIAVMNLEAEEITLDLELLDPDGREIATAQAVLVGNGHRARFVNQFEWSESIDFLDFQGLLKVHSTGQCAATVIQTRPGQFATMPVAPIHVAESTN